MDTSWKSLPTPNFGGDAYLGYAAKAMENSTSLLDSIVKGRQKEEELADARYAADVASKLKENELFNDVTLKLIAGDETTRHNLATEANSKEENRLKALTLQQNAENNALKNQLELAKLLLKGNTGSTGNSGNSGNSGIKAQDVKNFQDITDYVDTATLPPETDVSKTFKEMYPDLYNKTTEMFKYLPQGERDWIKNNIFPESDWFSLDTTQAKKAKSAIDSRINALDNLSNTGRANYALAQENKLAYNSAFKQANAQQQQQQMLYTIQRQFEAGLSDEQIARLNNVSVEAVKEFRLQQANANATQASLRDAAPRFVELNQNSDINKGQKGNK